MYMYIDSNRPTHTHTHTIYMYTCVYTQIHVYNMHSVYMNMSVYVHVHVYTSNMSIHVHVRTCGQLCAWQRRKLDSDRTVMYTHVHVHTWTHSRHMYMYMYNVEWEEVIGSSDGNSWSHRQSQTGIKKTSLRLHVYLIWFTRHHNHNPMRYIIDLENIHVRTCTCTCTCMWGKMVQ